MIYHHKEPVLTADHTKIAVILSATAEWDAACQFFLDAEPQPSPLGDWFTMELGLGEQSEHILFFHGGWGKISAAASAQYLIDRWGPQIIVNLGTCGGFAGAAQKGDLILARRTVVYDIIEQMGDAAEAIAHYSTDLDLGWLGPLPDDVIPATLVSADRDLLPGEMPLLREEFGAVAGDWESGAIAYVAARNGVRCLILRAVSDVVGPDGSDAYGDYGRFREAAREIIWQLLDALPRWLGRFI